MNMSADEAAKFLGVFLYSSPATVEAAYLKNSEDNARENFGNPTAQAEAQKVIDEAYQLVMTTIESYSVPKFSEPYSDLSKPYVPGSPPALSVPSSSAPTSGYVVPVDAWSSLQSTPGSPLNYRSPVSEVKYNSDYDTLYKNPRTSDPLWVWGAISTIVFIGVQVYRIFGSSFGHRFVFTSYVGGELIVTLVGLFFVFWISAGIPARFRRKWDKAWLGFILGYLVVAPIVFLGLAAGLTYGVPLFDNLQAGNGWSFSGQTQGQAAAQQQFIEQYESQGFHVEQGTGIHLNDIVVYAPLTGQIVTFAPGFFVQPEGYIDPPLAGSNK